MTICLAAARARRSRHERAGWDSKGTREAARRPRLLLERGERPRDLVRRLIAMVRALRSARIRSRAGPYPHPPGTLDAEIIIANAPDPVFVSDLEGKILQANDAVSELLGFRPDEVLEQSLSRFISPKEKREFTAALRAVVEHGVTRNAVLHPRSASGEVIPTTLNASALRDPGSGQVIGAIGILRDM